MKTLQLTTMLIAAAALMSSCSKDSTFNSGWNEQIIDASYTIDINSTDDIEVAIFNPADLVADYVNANHPDVKTYRQLEVTPMSGSATSELVIPLPFVEALDLYAVHDGREVLIGMMNRESSAQASFGLTGVDYNLLDLAEDDEIRIVVRPQFNDLTSGVEQASVYFTFNFNFIIDGTK